ncbi:MAG: NTP transferase domain-containing protein, partial [Deltaproteobacteria bacterium]|nr:NTP transferase domain-containing protein [Deltaproteobacteria bacterium]
MKCLIIAAGKGSRLWQKGHPKPLVPILGLPLLERVIRSALEAGLDDFYVVTGYEGEKVSRFLNDLTCKCPIKKLTHITNEAWNEENGLSVLKARRYLEDKFVLLMADHLFDADILIRLKQQPLGDDEVTLAVDLDESNRFVNLEDATKVEITNGKIVNIGKKIERFNALDMGIFLSTPAIFDGITESISKHNDSTLSGGMRCLAARGKVNAFVNENAFWIDVDDPRTLDRAEKYLLNHLKDKPTDGPVARYINRPLSSRITRYLVKTAITPNQISLVSFIFSLLAACMFIINGYVTLAAGGVLAQLASILDGCDGEVSRLKFKATPFGGWFDAVLDRYADALLLFGLTWHAYAGNDREAALFAGFFAIIGSFMLSYTADKYDAMALGRLKTGRWPRLGRDVRVFFIFLGTLLNQPFFTLLVIAVLMNAETV